MIYIWIALALIFIVSTHLIAQKIGAKREIGYGKTVFWSVLFSPIIGLVIALSSNKIEELKI